VPWQLAVVVDAVVWAAWSALVGWWHARQPADRFARDGPVLRARRWESVRWYERGLHVKTWKDALPEAGSWFGGVSKRRLPPGGPAGRARLLPECRRAERTHWWILAATPWFALWNPAWLFAAMAAFALVANVPCIAVLRYTRLRLVRAASREG
jgi:glycosyl-4,4'-diaponeurosporenoate acyltransferase